MSCFQLFLTQFINWTANLRALFVITKLLCKLYDLKKVLIIISLIFLSVNIPLVFSWGFRAHKAIAQMAVFVLPQEMTLFYKTYIVEFQEASIQPDIRRYIVAEEKPRHYIDLDRYSDEERNYLMQGWSEAEEKIGTDTLSQFGILPFAIHQTVYRLTESMKTKDGRAIIRYSGDLAHYIGDAHVPLHTTENYNGQLTAQEGIHALWETRIPEVEMENYDFWNSPATYQTNVHEAIWDTILHSHALVDSVLVLEKLVTNQMRQDEKYAFESTRTANKKTYSESFTRNYSQAMNGMVERQLRRAIQLTGDLMFTCWVNAGQPDLSGVALEKEKKSKKEAPVGEANDVHH
jgi:hypothetical protein